MSVEIPEETQLDRIERKLDSLLSEIASVKENAPKYAEEIQRQIAGTPLGKLLLRGMGKNE